MTNLVSYLESIAGTGEIVTIAYAGGSRPGEARDVVVLSCSGDDLWVSELNATHRKQFKLRKILWVRTKAGKVFENEQVTVGLELLLPKYDTLAAYALHFRTEFEAAGWHVHESESMLGVGAYFKNGKPRKTPSITICFIDRSTELVCDYETGRLTEVEKTLTGKERPWCVDSWRFKTARSFRLLEHAMRVFLEEVRASSPGEAKGMFAGH